jgi:hypothetical protein
MKSTLGVLAALGAMAALGAVAIAQTPTPPATPPAPAVAPPATPPVAPSACGELPPEPTLPAPGTVSTAAQMKDLTENTVNKWIAEARPILTCRQNEANTLAAELRAKKAAWDARSAEFTSAQTKVTQFGAKWQTEIDAFNARNTKGGVNRSEGKTGRSSR